MRQELRPEMAQLFSPSLITFKSQLSDQTVFSAVMQPSKGWLSETRYKLQRYTIYYHNVAYLVSVGCITSF